MKILSIDLGLKRIGLAISLDENIVTPLPAVHRKNRNQASNDVRDIANEWEVEKIVVGIPMNGDSEDEMRRRVTHFMKLVNINVQIELEDESESSLEAEALMKGEIRQKKDGRIDSLAAKIILERYLSRTTL